MRIRISKYVDVIVLAISEDGDNSCEDPLVPIPNTKVKLTNADNIWWETAREDRKLPSTRRTYALLHSFFLFEKFSR